MKIGRIAMPLGYSLVGALVLMGYWPSHALAQNHDAHMMTSQQQSQTAEQRKQGNALVKIVRDATERSIERVCISTGQRSDSVNS
jgi:hypothetical protein